MVVNLFKRDGARLIRIPTEAVNFQIWDTKISANAKADIDPGVIAAFVLRAPKQLAGALNGLIGKLGSVKASAELQSRKRWIVESTQINQSGHSKLAQLIYEKVALPLCKSTDENNLCNAETFDLSYPDVADHIA